MIVLAFTDSAGRPNRQEFFQSLDLKITTSDADYRTRYKTHSACALWHSHCKISLLVRNMLFMYRTYCFDITLPSV